MKSTFDLIRESQPPAVEPPPRFEALSGCPVCHQTSARFVVGHRQIEICKDHELYWPAVLNPWSQSSESEAEQKQQWTANNLDNYKLVSPWFLGQTIATA